MAITHHRSFITGCLLALLLALPGSSAGQNPVGFSITGASVTEKDTFTVSLNADTLLTGRDVYAYRFHVTYSPTYLEFLGVPGTGAVLSSWGAPTMNSENAGSIVLAGAGTAPLEGTGEMVQFRFRARRPGNTTIGFNTGESYLNEGNPPSAYSDGPVSAAGLSYPDIYPDSRDLYIGDEVAMSVSGGEAPFTYTADDPQVAQITGGDTVRAVGPGTTRITVTDNNGESSTTSGLFDVRAIRMDLEPVDVWPADTFYLPVRIEVAPGTTVYSGRFDLDHHGSLAGLEGMILQGDYSPNIQAHTGDGNVSVSFASTSGITGSGVLCYLGFRAGSSGNRYVNLSSMRFNETLYAWNQAYGYDVNVRSLPNLSLSPSYGNLMWGETQKIDVSNGTGPYTWKVSDTGVASVDAQGNLSAITGGAVRVTATDANGATTTSGIFTVYDHEISVYNSEGVLDTETRVPVISSSLPSGKKLFSYRASFSFNDNHLEFVRAEGANGNGLVQGTLDGTTIDVAGALGEGVSSGVIGYLVFNVTNSLSLQATTTISMDAFTANENSLYSVREDGFIRRVEQTSYRPVAVAGANFSIQEGEVGQLDGTASFDLDGDPLTYHWSTPDGFTLSDTTSPTPEFVAPAVESDSVFPVQLTVSDGTDQSDPATVEVTVLQVNHPPEADAGPDENYVEGASVTLDGSSSFDPDGDALSWQWNALDGIVLFDAASPTPSFILPQVQQTTEYRFTLTVHDGALSSATDTVTITAIQVNQQPVAFAGGDFSVDENTSYTLDGSLSYDADNDPLTYRWTAPPEVTLSSETVANPSFTAPSVIRDSVMVFELVVNDGNRDSEPDRVQATVVNLDSLSRETYIDSVSMTLLDSFALDTAAAEVVLYLPYGQDITVLAPSFTLSRGASVYPPGGSTQDFTTPVYYTVTAEDGVTTRMWKVEVYRPQESLQRTLDAGWNWISLNVQPEHPEIDSLFTDLSLSDQDYIKSSEYSSIFYAATGWFGDLEVFPRHRMVRFRKSTSGTLDVQGEQINPAVTSIPLARGWNDIAFLLQENAALDEAFDTGTLPAGEVILKSRNGSSVYYEGSGWTGEVDSLRVLHGYRLHVEETGSLGYQPGSPPGKKSAGIHPTHRELLGEYGIAPQDYAHSATLIAEAVSADGERVTGEGDRLVAMAGTEIRGVSRARFVPALDRHLFVLTYFSGTNGEEITFRLERDGGAVTHEAMLRLDFREDAITGSAYDPWQLILGDLYTGIEEPGSEPFSVYPNPASEEIRVQAPAALTAIRIYDLNGRLIRQWSGGTPPGTIPVGALKPGIYTLEAETVRTNYREKIIVHTR